jgi:MtN3 and saliva related transmembrane protein
MLNVDMIGLVAGLLTTFSFAPQSIKTIKTKDVSSLSLTMCCMQFVGILAWFTYGVALNNTVLIVNNIVCLFLFLPILYFKLKGDFSIK